MHQNEEYAVTLENVTKRYDDVVAVSNLSLQVHRGEYFFLLGPSGCGKSVVLRLIAGLEKPTSGTIYIDGRDMQEVPDYQRNTPMVFQKLALFPHMTARDNIEYPLNVRGIDKKTRQEKASQMLQLVGLEAMAHKVPSELSGGQRQRIAVARAFITDPTIMLLDEPLGSLDANLHAGMIFELRALHKRLGATFIQVTSNQSDALAVADRIAVMRGAGIEQIGTPQEIFDLPRTRFVAEFMANNDLLEGEVVSVTGEKVVFENELGRFAAQARDHVPAQGDRVCCAIRHDRISLGDGPEYDNRVIGNFVGQQVLGMIVRYVFRLANQQDFKADELFGSVRRSLKVNKQLTLAWKSVDSVIVG